MIAVIDNYDSFTYNLVQYMGELGAVMHVYRNDAVALEELEAVASKADQKGFVEHVLEACLAAGRIEAKNGRDTADARFTDLERDAADKGYGQIAKLAAAARRR